MKIESWKIEKKKNWLSRKLRTMHGHVQTYTAIEQEASMCKNHDSDCRKPVIAGPFHRVYTFSNRGVCRV